MLVFNCLGIIGVVLLFSSLIILKQITKEKIGDKSIESYVLLLSQSLAGFNNRIISILVQFLVISNILLAIVTQYKNQQIDIMLYLAFDFTVIVFVGGVVVMLSMLPNSISYIFSLKEATYNDTTKRILISGFFQTVTFFGIFIIMIYFLLSLVGSYALIACSAGTLIVSFYYRSAGGAFKAASESNQKELSNEHKVLTHPNEVLTKTGEFITSVGGYFLDIFSSWMIAITAFFMFISLESSSKVLDFIQIIEVQWVLLVIISTGISTLLGMLLISKNNKRNIFLEIGYFICGISYFQVMFVTYLLPLENKIYYYVFITIALLMMLGIAFFTNYLTSANHKPVRFICKQAQYGGANVLISSFFNGIIGNAVFMLLILIILVSIYNILDVIGLILIIIYALSIAVIACGIKVFSVITNQVITILDLERPPIIINNGPKLKKVSYTLISIGNTFSSAAGLLSSMTVLVLATLYMDIQLSDNIIDFIFGIGLGIVAIAVFYGLTISGTYTTLIESGKEVLRQIKEIPHILEKHKAHPNITRLSERHSVNGLKAITLPGTWILISLIMIYLMISYESVYGALIGMFLTVLIQGFFWSLFGDTVASTFSLIRSGLYGGENTQVFTQVQQAYYYAHYFQWVLAPSGVIIMKFIGMIALLILLA